MGVQRLLRLRMASHSCSRPAALAPHAARPFSSLLAPTPSALSLRSAPLTCAARPCPIYDIWFFYRPGSEVENGTPAHVGLKAVVFWTANGRNGDQLGTRHAAGRRPSNVAAMSSSTPPPPVPVQKSEEEWQAILTPEQFNILRRKGTEYPGTGEYDKFFEEGIYQCAGCGTPLYKSSTKFNSGCGWPAFYEGLPGAIKQTPDPDGRRTEITCAACGGHLGHIFKGEGFKTPTNERHCVNSISLKFTPSSEEA